MLLPSLRTVPEGKASLDKVDDEEGDEVVLPSSHDAQVAFDVVSLARVGQVELEHCRVPILRCPRLEGIFLSSVETGSDAGIDSLALVVVCHDKDVDEGAENEKKTENVGDEPSVVQSDAEFVGVRSRSQPENQRSSAADEDKCRACCTIAGMALVHNEVLWFALELVIRAVVSESKSSARSTVEPTNHGRNKRQLNDGNDHQEADGHVQRRTRKHFAMEKGNKEVTRETKQERGSTVCLYL